MEENKGEVMVGIGVVGCGYWGPNLIRNFKAIPGAKMRMVCDLDVERLKYIEKLYPGVLVTTDYNEMLNNKEIHAIVVATPVGTHYELARASLMSGRHTFIEKPMASNSEQCEELIEISEAGDLILMVGHTFIYSVAVQQIIDILDSGSLGNLMHISSQRLSLGLFQNDVNAAWDLATHDISIINYIMSDSAKFVNCTGKSCYYPTTVADTTNMTLVYPSGLYATVQSSWLNPNKVRLMTFVGTQRMLVYDDVEPLEKIKIYDKRVDMPPYYDTFAEFQHSYHYGDIYIPHMEQVEPLRTQCEHFIMCIVENVIPASSGYDGLDVVRVLEAADKSLEEHGAMVRVK